MKVVKEYLNEVFSQESDPVEDMSIGRYGAFLNHIGDYSHDAYYFDTQQKAQKATELKDAGVFGTKYEALAKITVIYGFIRSYYENIWVNPLMTALEKKDDKFNEDVIILLSLLKDKYISLIISMLVYTKKEILYNVLHKKCGDKFDKLAVEADIHEYYPKHDIPIWHAEVVANKLRNTNYLQSKRIDLEGQLDDIVKKISNEIKIIKKLESKKQLTNEEIKQLVAYNELRKREQSDLSDT